MKKIVFLLSVIFFFSCNREEMYYENVLNQKNAQTRESNFNVEKSDIENIVANFFNSVRTKSHKDICKIVAIDTISKDYIITRSHIDTDIPRNLLYLVKLADGSTMVVGGDKRAEPVYAHFNNFDLRINDKGELIGKDSIPDIVGSLIENCIVDIKNKTINNKHANDYYSNNQNLTTRSVNTNEDEVHPKLAYRFTDAYSYNENSNNYNTFTSQDIRPWTIHALCVAIPDKVEIRSFDGYKLKTSWKQAKKLDVTQLQGDMYQDFVEMSSKIPNFKFAPNSEISGVMAFEAVKNFFSGADGIPSLSYDTDWFNILNNLRQETGISYIYGYRDRQHPTFFRRTSYYNFSFFLADGYKNINSDYYIHVVGPIGNHGIISGYVLDLNRKNAGRFQDTHWKEWYGVPYQTGTFNLHTTKYIQS